MSADDGIIDHVLALISTSLAIVGIVLLMIGSYLWGFGWRGLLSITLGIVLLGLGAISLLRQNSTASERLAKVVEDLFLST
ncbi:MAG: hypothetical protein ABEI52_13205 [Halobacteriaceae archaeon]